MKSQWTILLISAFTDAIITAGTAFGTASANGTELSKTGITLIIVGGLVAFARTIQQALKATPEATAELKGDPPPKK